MNEKEKILFGVVANKNDLYEEQTILSEEGKQYINKINALFFEKSAIDYRSVENLFMTMANKYVNLIKTIMSKNRDIYEGEYNDKVRKKEGKGILKYNNGDIYEGNWLNDKKMEKETLY